MCVCVCMWVGGCVGVCGWVCECVCGWVCVCVGGGGGGQMAESAARDSFY